MTEFTRVSLYRQHESLNHRGIYLGRVGSGIFHAQQWCQHRDDRHSPTDGTSTPSDTGARSTTDNGTRTKPRNKKTLVFVCSPGPDEQSRRWGPRTSKSAHLQADSHRTQHKHWFPTLKHGLTLSHRPERKNEQSVRCRRSMGPFVTIALPLVVRRPVFSPVCPVLGGQLLRSANSCVYLIL
jgi:hypothetical protein